MSGHTQEGETPTPAEHREQKRLAEDLKGKRGVKNPYGLAWWVTRHEKDKGK